MKQRHVQTLIETNFRLPLWPTVIFFDWHGVLCHQPFWHKLLSNRANRNYELISHFVSALFADEEFIRGWMTGRYSARDVLSRSYTPLIPRSKDDFLIRQLRKDCLQMEIDAKALDMFRELRSGNLVVLATDNMDCFAEALSTRKFAAGIFDDVLCSSELKCLKEHPREFFGPWLAKHGMRFADAILIDDNPANCTAFELAGGQTVLYNHGRDFFEKLMGKLRAEKE